MVHERDRVIVLDIGAGADGDGYERPLVLHEPFGYLKNARQCEGRDQDLMNLSFPLFPPDGSRATVGDLVDILARNERHRVLVIEIEDDEGERERLLIYRPEITPDAVRVEEERMKGILRIRFGYEEL